MIKKYENWDFLISNSGWSLLPFRPIQALSGDFLLLAWMIHESSQRKTVY